MPLNTPSLLPGGGGNTPFGQVAPTGINIVSVGTGTALSPVVAFSDISLGFYSSASSTIAQSYGTFSVINSITSLSVASTFSSIGSILGGTVWSNSGISVGSSGNTGSLIPAISSLSSSVGVWVVQGSASSFTGIAWPAAKVGDIILTGVLIGAGASSVSSGLVPWSHVTVAGQIEFRLSNCSTLVQNQSAQTWVFTRISPF